MHPFIAPLIIGVCLLLCVWIIVDFFRTIARPAIPPVNVVVRSTDSFDRFASDAMAVLMQRHQINADTQDQMILRAIAAKSYDMALLMMALRDENDDAHQ